MKKGLIIIKKTFFTSLTVFLVFIITYLNIPSTITSIDKGSNIAYKPNQSEIVSFNKESNTNNYISIREFYNYDENEAYVSIKDTLPSVDSNTVITIGNGLELYAFSCLCNGVSNNNVTPNDDFLSYKYILINNISYNSKYRFIPVGFLESNPFTGVFDGRGYDINNLYFKSYSATDEETFSKQTYLSMFASVGKTGEIKNFGLINTENIQRYKLGGFQGTSPLVGINWGKISNVYAQDLRKADEEAGISALGGYVISGLVCVNYGSIDNVYTAYSVIVNYTIQDWVDFRPIVMQNFGSITNAYFVDLSIKDFTNGIYTYDSSLLSISIDTNDSNVEVLGTYTKTISELNETFKSLNNWYSPKSYSSIKVTFKTPILRGLKEDSTDPSGLSFLIDSEEDFAYMFELIENNSFFASNRVTYKITNDIDLSFLDKSNYQYDDFFGANIITSPVDSNLITLADGSYSTNPTIYNVDFSNYVDYLGYRCYGLFPLFNGSIKGLNIYSNNMLEEFDEYDSSVGTRCIGLVSGFSEGASVEDLGVYGKIKLSTKESVIPYNFGKHYTGIIFGVASRETKIYNSTVSGSIDGSNHVSSVIDSPQNGYPIGNCIGGLVGYTLNSIGNISNCLANVNITATNFSTSTNIMQNVGGVIGGGYTSCFNQIANKGNIVSTSTNDYYQGDLYIAGIIGHHYGSSNAIYSLHNQGDISYTIKNSFNATMSGVLNSDILISDEDTLVKSKLSTLTYNGLSNSGDFIINNSLTMTSDIADSLNLRLAGVCNLNTERGFSASLDGVYNLGYMYNSNGRKVAKDNMEIDIASIKSFAPCIITSSQNAGNVKVKTIYNLRNIDFIQSQDLYFTDVKYSGCIIGTNIDYEDVRNDGDLTFNIVKNASRALNYSTSKYKSFYVYGVFEEVSKGCSADTIYNGGNINFIIGNSSNKSLNFYYNLYISGICFQNLSGITDDDDFAKFDPLNKNYDKKSIGTLARAINKGNITATSYSVENDTSYSYLSDSVITSTISTSGYLKGESIVSGICIKNESIISSSYNLGKIVNHNFLVEATSNYSYNEDFKVLSAGIAIYNISKYAQIKDSANNGRIEAINNSSFKGDTFASGIVVRNDCLSDGSSYSNTSNQSHHKQLVCFTINYGEIFAFSYATRISSGSRDNASSISSGIICKGLCSILNTVNYGNIFGSEVISGMFGIVDFYNYSSEVTSLNPVNLANSINYGKALAVKVIISPSGVPQALSYSIVKNIDSSSEYLYTGASFDCNYVAALIGIINYSDSQYGTSASENIDNIKIRYLINFYQTAKVINEEFAIPSNQQTPETLVSTKYNDTFMGNKITYAPLTSIDDEAGNIGVFSKNFKFMRAINGEIDSSITTDKFIPDYFSFIGFTKINTNLLESIGWRSVAYQEAAERFSIDLDSLITLLNKYNSVNSSDYNLIKQEAFNTENWINNCNINALKTIIDDLIKDENNDGLKSIITYLFFNSNYSSSISDELRASVIDSVLITLNQSKENLIKILDGLMYNDLLANIISENDAQYLEIKNILKKDLNLLSKNELMSLCDTYLGYLNNSSNTYYDTLFNNDLLSNERVTTLDTLLSGIDEKIITDILSILDNSQSSYKAMMNYALADMDDTEKKNLYISILANNSTEGFNDAVSSALKKIDVTEYISEDNTEVLTEFEESFNDSYIDLWNQVKNTDNFKNYLNENILIDVTSRDGIHHQGIYAKATEYTNTYQSNDAPAGTSGRTRAINQSDYLNTRFIYTPDSYVSDKTYYYGPFVDTSGVMWSTTSYSGGGYTNQGYDLAKNTVPQGSSSKQIYVPVFISLDEKYISDLVKNTSWPTNVAKFFWNNVPSYDASQCAQWVNEACITNEPNNNKYALLKNYNASDTLYYDYNSVGFTTTTSEISSKIALSNIGNNAVIPSGYTNSGVTSNQEFLYSYCSSSFITGIYYQQDQWDGKSSFLTAKSNQGFGVVTTSYIDYSLEDLLLLDGIRTKGNSSNAISNDEVEIINSIMSQVMSTNKGISLVMSELNSQICIDNTFLVGPATNYLNSLCLKTGFVNSFLGNLVYISGAYDFVSLDSKTYKTYLEERAMQLDFTDYQRIVIAAMDSKENFNRVIKYLLDDSTGYYAYLSEMALYTWYSSKNSDYLQNVTTFISDAINLNYTDSEIRNMFNTINEQDVTNYISNYHESLVATVTNNTINSDFSLNSEWIGLVDYQTYNDITYISSIKPSDNTGTINFNTPSSDGDTYKLNILAYGNGSIKANNIVLNVSALSNYSFSGLSDNTLYTIDVSQDVKIIKIDVVKVDSAPNFTQTDITYSGWERLESTTSKTINNVTYTTAVKSNTVGDTITLQNITGNSYAFIATNSKSSTSVTSTSSVSGFNYYGGGNTSNKSYVSSKAGALVYAFGASNAKKTAPTTYNFTFDEPFNSSDGNVYKSYATFQSGIKEANSVFGFATNRSIKLNLDYDNSSLKFYTTASATFTVTDSSSNSKTVQATANSDVLFENLASGSCTLTTSAATNVSNFMKTVAGTNEEQDIYSINSSTVCSNDLALSRINYLNNIDDYSSNFMVKKYISEQNKNLYEALVLSDYYVGTYSTSITKQGSPFSINASESNLIVNSEKTTSISGFNFDRQLEFSAGGSTEAGNISFTASENSLVYIFASSDNSSNLSLSYNGITTTQKTSNSVGAYIYQIDTTTQVDCYIYSSSRCFIYEILVVSNRSIEDEHNNSWFSDLANTNSVFDINIISTYSDFVLYSNRYINCFKDTTRVFNDMTLDDLRNNDIQAVTLLLYGVTDTDHQLYNKLTQDEIKELLIAVISKDKTAFGEYLNYCNDTKTLKSMISEICSNNNGFYCELIQDNIDKVDSDMLVAAYIGCDFDTKLNSSLLLDSKIYTILDSISLTDEYGENFEPQFIESNSSLNNDLFLKTVKTLGFNLTTDGYGIYAVSSSEGILNGNFIPDNIDFTEYDPYYTYDSTIDRFVCSDTKDSSWRGGVNSDGTAIKDDTQSVNYDFYVSMKQLNKSIATTIFYMQLESEDGKHIINSIDEMIDLNERTIMFYVGENFGSSVLNQSYHMNLDPNTYKISYAASLGDNKTNTVSVGGYMELTVIAEDTDERKTYKIYLIQTKEVSLELSSVSANGGKEYTNYQFENYICDISGNEDLYILPENGSIHLKFNSLNVPNYSNLYDILTLQSQDTNSSYDHTFYSLEDIDGNGIVDTEYLYFDSTNNVWGNGECFLYLKISDYLPNGEYSLNINFSDNLVYKINFKKKVSTDSTLTSIVFNDSIIEFDSNGESISYINYGRNYAFEDLYYEGKVCDGKPNYIQDWIISPLANVKTLVSIETTDTNIKTVDNVKYYINGIITYVITYNITAEDGVSTNTYTHKLQEVDPFASAKGSDGNYITEDYNHNNYVSLTKDGSLVNIIPNEIGEIYDSFERGYEPKYRLTYNFTSFYNSESIINYLNIDSINSESYMVEKKYYGLYINFYNDSDAVKYDINFSYQSDQALFSENGLEVPVIRQFDFPNITIEKLKSTDSKLKKITFIEGASKISSLATVGSIDMIYPESGDNVSTNPVYGYLYSNPDKNDLYYDNANEEIIYSNRALSTNNYYLVGTVSNASLDEYAPTFKIENHASIYQFKEIDSKRYLYIEFLTSITSDKESSVYSQVFLVSDDFKYVYDVEYNGQDESYIAELSSSKEFTYNGNNYYISPYSGTVNSQNRGLNMDYIGTPGVNEFWYVKYIIYSENYVDDNISYSIYNIAILDLTNTVAFTITLIDESTQELLSTKAKLIYLTIICKDPIRDANNNIQTGSLAGVSNVVNCTVGTFLEYDENTKTYVSKIPIQALQYGYYYFYLDLPSGYGCSYEITTSNKVNALNQIGDGSYLPPTSIVTQKVSMTISINDSDENKFLWGEKVLEVVQHQAEQKQS